MKIMFNMVCQELKKEMMKPWFYIGIIGACLLWHISMLQWLYGGVLNALYMNQENNYIYFIALFVSLASSCCFLDDYNSGFFKSVVIRTNSKLYFMEKIITTAISTFIISFFSFLITCIVDCLYYRIIIGDYQDLLPFYNLYKSGMSMVIIIIIIAIKSFVMIIFSEYALAFSAIIPNKFAAILMPFVAFIMLDSMTFLGKFKYNIHAFLGLDKLCDGNEFMGIVLTIITVFLYCIVANIIFIFFAKRRIKCEIN